MKINIRESLRQIDAQTFNKYELSTKYESLNRSVESKKNLAKLISEGASPEKLNRALSNRTRKRLSEEVNRKKSSNYRGFVIFRNIAGEGYDVYYPTSSGMSLEEEGLPSFEEAKKLIDQIIAEEGEV